MTLSSSEGALSYPRRDGHSTRRTFDHGKLIVGQSKVHGVAARVTCGGSSARSLRFHATDITVKQKKLASHELMLYDKDMNTNTAQAKFDSLIAGRTLDQAVTDLTVNDESTVEGMKIRVALIRHIEKLSPAISAWVNSFYGEDGLDNEEVDYRDAILLARKALS